MCGMERARPVDLVWAARKLRYKAENCGFEGRRQRVGDWFFLFVVERGEELKR